MNSTKLLRFTIHFATINTSYVEINNAIIDKFTIHFATINTNPHVLMKGVGY